jgi:hypothetical protein
MKSWEIGFKGRIMDENLHLMDGILAKKVAINRWMDGWMGANMVQ